MKEGLDGAKWSGQFNVRKGKKIHGDLTLAGAKTLLRLHDKSQFDTRAVPNLYIRGILDDLTKVSLIKCITLKDGSGHRGKEHYHFANVFPHFVVYGDHYLAPDRKTITEAHFDVDDASTLFYDFDAFGRAVDARPYIRKILHGNAQKRRIANPSAPHRRIVSGADPQIFYFTGKTEIFAADTVLGKISAFHSPNYSYGGPNGFHAKNTITVSIRFKTPRSFEGAIIDVATLIRCLEIMIGRPQNLLKLALEIRSNNEIPPSLTVYWSMRPNRDASREWFEPHPGDVLVSPVEQPQEFARILTNWLSRENEWHGARSRFSQSFAQQKQYGIERLIGCANMFDILPTSAVPADVLLPDELTTVIGSARTKFRALGQSPQRDSILSALGRVGKANLKQKIRHRAQRIIDAVGTLLPGLLTVTDEAVNCRNYYVHGGKPTFDYDGNFDAVIFFIDALEFVFVASDLIDAGWDVNTWSKRSTTMSHPFARFKANYSRRLRMLRDLVQ
jgi:hypothetical protein